MAATASLFSTTRSSSTLSEGSDRIFNYGATKHTSVSALDSQSAVVCYEDDGNSDKACCAVVRMSSATSTSLSAGSEACVHARGWLVLLQQPLLLGIAHSGTQTARGAEAAASDFEPSSGAPHLEEPIVPADAEAARAASRGT